MTRARVRAVFFDVDFTLIYPGPTFQGDGYAEFCRRHGIEVDPDRFPDAVIAAASILSEAQDHTYDERIFLKYTRRIIEAMGGFGERLDACAKQIFEEWGGCQHFFLYDDVAPALETLAARGLTLGVISNSHRCLDSFRRHFALDGMIAIALSSCEHGYLKPHPSIFESALSRANVSAAESVMVGDSLPHDVEGARSVGMRAILIQRSARMTEPVPAGVDVIRDLSELPALL